MFIKQMFPKQQTSQFNFGKTVFSFSLLTIILISLNSTAQSLQTFQKVQARNEIDAVNINQEINDFNSITTPNINCMDGKKTLPIMNETALDWKTNKKSGYKDRALLSGSVDFVFSDKTGHRHFSMKIGPRNEDRIEVIYNQSFGVMPIPKIGDSIEACGDFIVATKQNGNFPPSPDGAIIHWVHKSPNKGHDDGYVILNGSLYGFGGREAHKINWLQQFFASENKESTKNIDILSRIKLIVSKCAIKKVSKSDQNQSVFLGIESVCPSLIINSEWTAEVFVHNEWLYATLTPSKYTDIGDLNNLEIRDGYGTFIASRKNIAAFNNVIFALVDKDQIPIVTLEP